MASNLPPRPYLSLVAGIVIFAVLLWATIGEFETGTVSYKGAHIHWSDNPIGFGLMFLFSLGATVGLGFALCILVVRIWRAHRDRAALSQRRE